MEFGGKVSKQVPQKNTFPAQIAQKCINEKTDKNLPLSTPPYANSNIDYKVSQCSISNTSQRENLELNHIHMQL
jgi:hypothetical protein